MTTITEYAEPHRSAEEDQTILLGLAAFLGSSAIFVLLTGLAAYYLGALSL